MAVVGYSVGKNWKKAAAISVCERIMLKTAQLYDCSSSLQTFSEKKNATPNILEGVMEDYQALRKEY